MASRKTLELLRLLQQISYKFYIVPFQLIVDRGKNSVGARLHFSCTPRHKFLCNLTLFSFITTNIVGFFILGITYDLNHAADLNLAARAQFYCLIAMLSMALSVAVFLLVCGREVWQLEDSICHFVTTLSKCALAQMAKFKCAATIS